MKQLAERLERLKKEIDNDFPKWADAILATTALTMIKTRILKSGEAATGSFSPYSTKDTLVGASSFRTKAQATTFFGTRGPKNRKSKKLEWRSLPGGSPTFAPAGFYSNYRRLAVLPGGYKKLRQLVGSESGFKNFTWSGEMWGSMHIQIDKKPDPNAAIIVRGTTKTGEGKFNTIVGSENQLTLKKLEGHFKREGKEILMLSQKEEIALSKILGDYITNKYREAFNG